MYEGAARPRPLDDYHVPTGAFVKLLLHASQCKGCDCLFIGEFTGGRGSCRHRPLSEGQSLGLRGYSVSLAPHCFPWEATVPPPPPLYLLLFFNISFFISDLIFYLSRHTRQDVNQANTREADLAGTLWSQEGRPWVQTPNKDGQRVKKRGRKKGMSNGGKEEPGKLSLMLRAQRLETPRDYVILVYSCFICMQIPWHSSGKLLWASTLTLPWLLQNRNHILSGPLGSWFSNMKGQEHCFTILLFILCYNV